MDKDKHIQMQEYLDNLMSEEDSTAFEKELNNNEELQRDFDLLKDIEHELGNKELINFKKKLSGVMEQPIQTTVIKKDKGKVISLSRRILSLAASFLVIGLAGWWFLSQPASPEQIYANNFSVHPDKLSIEIEDRLSETGFGINKEALGNLQNAINTYNNGDYQMAIQQLNAYKNANSEDVLASYAQFYEAVALLKNGKIEAGQEQLESLSKVNFPLQADAQWYLALANLQQGNITKAKEILQSLTAVTRYQKKATNILNDL